MTVEVPVRRRRNECRLAAAMHVEGKCERSGPAGKNHSRPARSLKRNVMTTPFQQDLAHDHPVQGQDHDRVTAIRPAARSNKITCFNAVLLRLALQHPCERARG